MRAFITVTAIAFLSQAALAQTLGSAPGPSKPISTDELFGLDEGVVLLKPDMHISLEAERDLEQERMQSLATAGPRPKVAFGPQFDITHALVGKLQYHWTAGQKPELGWAGLPVRAKIKTNGVYFGFSYRP